jgi:hypothetical protein
MTEQELTYDTSEVVTHWDPQGLVPIAATLTLTSSTGALAQSPAVTLPTFSTTCAAGTTATILILASVTGLSVGDHLKVTTAGYSYVCEVVLINGTAKSVTLATALPVTPVASDTVVKLDMTATITALGIEGIGGNYRMAWTYSDATTTKSVGYSAAVVRWPWSDPCTVTDVREILSDVGGGNRSESWCRDVVEKVSDKIKARVSQTGRRPQLYLSSQVFSDVARAGIRYELAQRNIFLGGQPYEAVRELRFAFDDQLTAVITGLMGAYDSSSDGAISAEEAKPKKFSIRGVR